ncbi:MAG: sensor histidine kinase [Chloroflexi bacterium]|nr:MAG: sensor histidine kinase [Chloroflexota bacterium]
MDAAAREPVAGPFDTLHAEAKTAVGLGANTLRRVRDTYREAHAEELARWQELRDELDALERRSIDGLRAESFADDPTIVALAPAPAAGDVNRIRALRTTLEVLSDDLAARRTDLGRIEVALRSLDSAWLFLERGDTTLLGDSSADDDATTEAGPGEGALAAGSGPVSAQVQMRIVEAQEAERARLAQEVHDGPAQALANAIFQVEYIERVIDRDPGMARHELRFLRELLRRELGDVRGFITQLRPPVLAELGLDGAMRDAIEHMRALTGLTIVADIRMPLEQLGETEQTVVLRVVQEALQNVRKHASASQVIVSGRAEAGDWVLEIRDDGRGFEAESVAARGRRNFGLQFMRERAELIGARLDVRSGPDGGTVVRLAIPMGERESR